MALGDLVAHLSLNTAKFTSGLKTAQSSLSGFSSGIGASLSVGGVAGAAVAGLGTLIAGLSWPVQLAADAENSKIAFTTFLGSAQKADDLLRDLTEFAAATPFELPELKSASQMLLGFGVDAGQIIPVMRSLGDIAAGTGQPVKELAELYGKMGVQGRLQMEDVNQLTGRGIPIIQEFAKQFGVAESEVRDLVSSGKIGFSNLQQAIVDMTASGSKFGGLMAAKSMALTGVWSTLKDSASKGATDIGFALIEGFDFKGLIANASSFVDTFVKDWIPPITTAIKGIGAAWWEYMGLVQTVWTTISSAVSAGWEAIVGTTSTSTASMAELWNGWVIPAIDLAHVLIENWDVSLQLLAQYVRLGMMNALTYVETWGTNAIEIGTWVGENFSDIMFTLTDGVLTLFINLGTNVRAMWQSVLDFIATGEFTMPDMKPLLDGWRSTVRELPELTQAELIASTPQIDALLQEVATGMEERTKARVDAAAKDAAAGAMKIADLAVGPSATATGGKATKTADTKTAAGLALRGSREAYQSIIAAMDKNSPQLRVTKQQLAEQKKTTELLQKINKGFDSNKLGTATIS